MHETVEAENTFINHVNASNKPDRVDLSTARVIDLFKFLPSNTHLKVTKV